jgi:hypothetical protein
MKTSKFKAIISKTMIKPEIYSTGPAICHAVLCHTARYCGFHNAVTIRSAKKNGSRSRRADFGMGGAVIFAP